MSRFLNSFMIRSILKAPKLNRRLPLAWLILKKQPAKFVTAILGVAFAAILILMQFAIQESLYSSSVAIIKTFNADIIMLSKSSSSILGLTSFDDSLLTNAYDPSIVENVSPLRWLYIPWRLANSNESRLAIAIGVDPYQSAFLDPAIASQLVKTNIAGRVLYDRLSRPEFGPVASKYSQGGEIVAFSQDQRLKVAGLVSFGPSFGYDASIITSIKTVDAIYPGLAGLIEIGLIKLKPHINQELALKDLSKRLSADVRLIRKDDFITLEKDFWAQSKPIGLVFLFCATMGLVVGAVMVYQILSADVTYHISNFAVLLSIGYTRGRLEMILLKESLILSFIGFPLALAVSAAACGVLSGVTSLPMSLRLSTIAMAYFLIVSMCVTAALFAMRRLRDADPSDLFG